MKIHFGITSKLTLILVAVVAVLLAGFGIPSSIQGYKALEEAAEAELFSTSAEKALSIEYWLTDRENRISSLANSRALIRKVSALAGLPAETNLARTLRDDLVRDLGEWTASSPDFRAVMILDPRSGAVLASTDATHQGQTKVNETAFVHSLIGPYVQSLGYMLSVEDDVLAISTPLHDKDGLLVGILASEVNLESLRMIISAKGGMHWSDDAYLVNMSHSFVTRPRFLSIKESVQQKISTAAVDRCLTGESGVITAEDYRGVTTVSSYHWLANRQVCLIVEEDRDEVLAPLTNYSDLLTAISGLAVIMASLIAYFVAHFITRPFLALQRGVERFARGELNFRMPARSSDEIGQLEREFNRMAEALAEKESQLAGYASELEQMVQDRTQALRSSEAELRGLMNAMTDLILVIDDQGKYIKIPNPRTENLILPAEQLLGNNLANVLPAEVAKGHMAIIRQALRTGRPAGYQYSLTINGTVRWLNATASPISPNAVVWVSRDVTGFKQVEAALLENRRSLATLLSNLPGIAYRCRNDAHRTMEFISDGCLALTGYPAEALLFNHQLTYKQLVHPDDRPLVQKTIQTALDEQRPFQMIYRILPPEGEEKWVWEQGRGIYSTDGVVEALEGFIHDVTERERARRELQNNEQKFRNIIEQSSDGIVLTSLTGAIIEWNQAEERITGLSREQVIGRSLWDVQYEMALPAQRTPELRARGEAVIRSLIQQGDTMLKDRLVEVTIQRPNGEQRILQTAVFSIRAESGYLLGSISRDLTQQKSAEQALRESEQRYRTVIENAPDIIFTLTPSGVIATLNPAFEVITGFKVAEWVGKPFINLLRSEDLPQVEAVIAKVMRAETARPFNLHLAAPGESSILVEFSATPLLEDGQVTGMLGIARDIGERLRREQELETLLRLTTRLRAAGSRAAMLPVILDEVLELFHAASAIISMRDLATDEILVELGAGISAGLTGTHLPVTGVLSAAIIAQGTPRVINQAEFPRLSSQPHLLPRVENMVGIPLVTEEQAVGVLWMGRDAPITPGDVRLLSAIADIAAASIHRADLHGQMERSLQQLSALNMIDRAINSSLDLRVTLNVFLSQLTAQLHVDAADILLLRPHTNQLEFTAGKGFRGKTIETSLLQLGDGITGQAAANNQTVCIPNLAEANDSFTRSYLTTKEGFGSYFAMPLMAKGHLKGMLEVFHRTPLNPSQEWLNFLEALAGQATIAIENAQLFDDMQRSNIDLALAYEATIEGWSRALDQRDKETEGHTQRVADLTLQLAQMMGIKEEELVHIRRGALLHDIGKMGTPDHILLKPGPLNDEELAQMRKHPQNAYELIAPIGYLRPALDIPYAHHEKWDGTGYPRRLKGEQIPLSARIFAVVDVWDALISDRPYRKAWPKADAIQYIREQSGAHFDPRVVQAFLNLLSQ